MCSIEGEQPLRNSLASPSFSIVIPRAAGRNERVERPPVEDCGIRILVYTRRLHLRNSITILSPIKSDG